MGFEEYHKNKMSRSSSRSKKVNRRDAIQTNKHINFTREKKKGNARKDPTKVTCVECGVDFVLPFKPRRPEVFCDDCFKKRR